MVAVPSNIVSKVVDDLIQFGTVQRAYLGIMIRDVNGELVDDKDLKVSNGVYVDSLLPESSAKSGGIKEGDVILSVEGKSVNSVSELQEAIGVHRPGDVVKVKLNRKGKELVLDVKLKNKNGRTDLVKSEYSETLSKLGLELEVADKKVLKSLDIDSGLRVKSVNPGKIRRQTNMREGFIITKVGSTPVSTIDEFNAAIEALKNEGVLIEGYYEGSTVKQYYAFGM